MLATGRQMKSTNLEWLGMIPEDWEERSIGRETWVRARLGWKGLTASEYIDEGIPMLATPNIKGRDLDFASAARISKERYDESPEIMLSVGDVLLTKDGSTIGIVNMVRELQEPATVNGSIAVITPTGGLNGRFLYWVIASQYAQSIFNRLRDGMGVPHLFQRDINRIVIPFPPLFEQQAIAGYLDCETQRIDELIAEQRGLIETLRERRVAAITESVFGRASHIVPLRRVADVIDCAHITANFVDNDHRYPVASIAECQGDYVDLSIAKYTTVEFFDHLRAGNRAPRDGDLLFVRNASVGTVAAVAPGTPAFAVGQETVLLRRKSSVLPDFLRFVLNSVRVKHDIDRAMIGSTFKRINVAAIRSLPIPLPSLRDQDMAVSYLDFQTSRIDALIADSEDLIALSQERRAALITAAVTGQIDVRKAA